MKLSKRLQTIADFVKKNSVVADIGTDHAHIPIYLIKNNIIDKAYACDINKGPLEKAKENIENFGVSENIVLRLSNGLDKMSSKEVDTIIIAGMGGELIIDILNRGKAFFDKKNTFMEVRYTENTVMYSEAELLYGKYLIENKHPVLLRFLKKEEEKYLSILSNTGLNEDRKKELTHRLDIIKETMNEMQ